MFHEIPAQVSSPFCEYTTTSVLSTCDRFDVLKCTASRFARPVVLRYVLAGADSQSIKASFKLLSQLTHGSISAFVESFDLPTAFAVASDYFEGYTLRASISESRPYSEDRARRVFSQVLEAVDSLHAFGVAHRNLTADNILIDDEQHIRLIGWSYLAPKATREVCRKPIATCWEPPESHAASAVTAFAADSWALGVLLHFLATGRAPWPPGSDDELRRAMTSGNVLRPQKMSLACHHLITRLLDVDPMRRFSPGQAKLHAWRVGDRGKRGTAAESANHFGQRMRPPRGKISP